MSYDHWLARPYEIDNDPPEDEVEAECAICGVVVPEGATYCGDACQMADEQELGDLNDPDPTYRPVYRLSPAEAWQRYLDMEEEWNGR